MPISLLKTSKAIWTASLAHNVKDTNNWNMLQDDESERDAIKAGLLFHIHNLFRNHQEHTMAALGIYDNPRISKIEVDYSKTMSEV